MSDSIALKNKGEVQLLLLVETLRGYSPRLAI